MTGFGEWLLSIFREILQFVIDIPLKVAKWLWDALLSLLSTSEITGYLRSAEALFGQIDPSVWYFMQVFQLPYGVSIVIAAYVMRFTIRRIPVIG